MLKIPHLTIENTVAMTINYVWIEQFSIEWQKITRDCFVFALHRYVKKKHLSQIQN